MPKPDVFAHHAPDEEQIGRIQHVRNAFADLLRRVEHDTKPGSCSGRYVALCKTALEEACQWAVKSIVFETYNQDLPNPSDAMYALVQRLEKVEQELLNKANVKPIYGPGPG